MADLPISGLSPIPTIDDADLLAIVDNTDGVTKKGTQLQIKDYISPTPLPVARGGTNSTTALNNDRVMISVAGEIVESSLITTSELDLLNGKVSVSTGVSDNDKFVTQGYVDDSVAGSGVIHDALTISSPGQTAFTLSQTPVGATSSFLTLNGQIRIYGTDYTISGTALTWNDPGGLTLDPSYDLQIWYNITAASTVTDQLQTYYVGDAGNDSNNGKSLSKPFLTLTAVAAAVVSQIPSFTNKFVIKMIGGMQWTGNLTIPDYTTVFGDDESEIIGDVTYGTESNSSGVRITGTAIKSTGGHSRIRSPYMSVSGSKKLIDQTGGALYVDCPRLEHAGTGVGIDHSGSGALHLNFDRLNSSALASTIRQNGGEIYINGKHLIKSNSGGEAIEQSNSAVMIGSLDYINATGVAALKVGTSSTLKLETKELSGTITDDGTTTLKLTRSDDPLSVLYTASTFTNITGDGTVYPLVFTTVDINNNTLYNTGTGGFSPDVKGIYTISPNIILRNLDSTHTEVYLEVNVTGGLPFSRPIAWLNGNNVKSPTSNDNLMLSPSVDIELSDAQTATVRLKVGTAGGGGNKFVDVEAGSSLSFSLKQTV